MLRYFTAGKSHGEALIALLSGVPAGLEIDQTFIDRELWRRQQGYGRGGRMKIERDQARTSSRECVRASRLDRQSPSCCRTRTGANWQEALPVAEGDPEKHRPVTAPRPGHADLAGVLKYNFSDARFVLERASARESAARMSVGAVAKLLLREFGIEVLSHVLAVGGAAVADPEVPWESLQKLVQRDEILLNCADAEAEHRMKEEVDRALKTGDSVGGVFEVVAHHVPPGLGNYANWDERLDGLLAGAVMSLPAVKAVEIGVGIAAAGSPGSKVHDEISWEPGRAGPPLPKGVPRHDFGRSETAGTQGGGFYRIHAAAQSCGWN